MIALEVVKKRNRIFIFIGLKECNFESKHDKFIFINNIHDAYLSFLYEKVDYFIITSTAEGLSFPVADAVDHGTIVLALKLPVFYDLYNNNDKVILFDTEKNFLDYISIL